MNNYIKCLRSVNNKVRESSVADFEFSEAREAVIFAQWMQAVLPIDENNWFSLPTENEGSLPANTRLLKNGRLYSPKRSSIPRKWIIL